MSKQVDQTVWAMIIVVFCFAVIFAILGTRKQAELVEIETFDVEELYLNDGIPLPDVAAEVEILPEILPPLYEEPLPPLQGEV